MDSLFSTKSEATPSAGRGEEKRVARLRGEKTAGGRGLEEGEGSQCLAPGSPAVRADTRLGVSPAKLSCTETDGHQEESRI